MSIILKIPLQTSPGTLIIGLPKTYNKIQLRLVDMVPTLFVTTDVPRPIMSREIRILCGAVVPVPKGYTLVGTLNRAESKYIQHVFLRRLPAGV